MKSIDELRQFFEQSIKPNLGELEAKRRKVSRKRIIIYLFFGSTAIVTFYFLIVSFIHSLKPDFFGILIIFILYGSIGSGFFILIYVKWIDITVKREDFRQEFKEAVIAPIIKFIEPDLKYSLEDRPVPTALFPGSKIFPPTSFYPDTDNIMVEDVPVVHGSIPILRYLLYRKICDFQKGVIVGKGALVFSTLRICL